jgi:hypothetical protein
VKDTYNSRPGEGLDRVLGRILAGLDPNEEKFCTLCPHFKEEGLHLLTEEMWSSTVSGYNKFTPEFKAALPFLLARLVYSYDFLEATLPPMERNKPTHPLWVSNIVRHGWIDRMKPFVVCEAGVHVCPHTGLKASGIPAFTLTNVRLARLEERMASFEEQIVNEIKSWVEAMPTKTAEEVYTIIQNRLEGAQFRMSPQDIQRLLDTRFDQLMAAIKPAQPAPAAEQNVPVLPVNAPNASARPFYWGNKYRRTPENFVFPHGPSISIKSAWDLWFFGGKYGDVIVGPYKFFDDVEDLKHPTDRSYLSKVRYVVEKIVEHGHLYCDYAASDIARADQSTSTTILKLAFRHLVCSYS